MNTSNDENELPQEVQDSFVNGAERNTLQESAQPEVQEVGIEQNIPRSKGARK